MYGSNNNSSFFLWPRIKGTNELNAYYGGDQFWLDRNTARRVGCAPTCGANILTILAMNSPPLAAKLGVSLDNNLFISKDDYTKMLNGIYNDMYIFELPWFSKRFDQLPLGAEPHFPVALGTNMLLFASGVKNYAKKYDILLEHRLMFTRGTSYFRGLAFIKLALANGYPVTILSMANSFEYTLFDKPFMQGACQKTMKYHFVTITDVRDTAVKDEPDIMITILGKAGRISYRTLYDSWQSLKAFGSGLCYFIPIDND